MNDRDYYVYISEDARRALRRERMGMFVERCIEWGIACLFGVLIAWAAVDQLSR